MNYNEKIKHHSEELRKAQNEKREAERKAREEARHLQNERVRQFHLRLEREHGLQNHPQREKLWGMAWDYGHSSGFSAVEAYYIEMAELLKGSPASKVVETLRHRNPSDDRDGFNDGFQKAVTEAIDLLKAEGM